MYGRREHIDFVTIGTPGTPLKNFSAPARTAGGDVLEPLGELGEGPPVQPPTVCVLVDHEAISEGPLGRGSALQAVMGSGHPSGHPARRAMPG
jgi:hypothetical protein